MEHGELLNITEYQRALDAERDLREHLDRQATELEQQVEELQTLQEELEQTNEELHASLQEVERARDHAEYVSERLRGILEAMPDNVTVLDRESRIAYMNPPAREVIRQMGKTPEDIVGQYVWAEFPHLVGTPFQVETDRAAKEQRVIEYEEYLPDLDARFEVRVIPFRDGVTALSRDVTARHRASDVIRYNERRYRALVDASTLMVWNTTSEGLVEDMPFWRELTGQSLEDVRGNGWTNAIHPQDRERVIATWRRAYETRTVYEADYRLQLRDGSSRWFRARGVPVLDEAGAVREWIGIFNDIDDQRREEEHGRFIVWASRELSSTLDYEETLRSIARAAVPALGDWCAVDIVRNPQEPTWPPVVERLAVVHTDPQKVQLAHELARRYPTDWSMPTGIPRVLREGVTEFLQDIPDELLQRLARDERHLQILRELGLASAVIVPLQARGLMLGALTLVTSESQRRYDARDVAVAEDLARRAAVAIDNARLFKEAERARREAEFASRAKTDFLTTMSHELRTPLNAIDGYAELLEMGIHGSLTDQQKDAITRIRRSQRHLLGLINDILHLSRIEAGRLELSLSEVDLHAIVEGATALIAPQVSARGQRLAYVPSSDPIVVRADAERLRQVLLNLLTNASKFTAEGGDIEVRCDRDAQYGFIRVRDSGIGIAPAMHERIFEPFVQLEREPSRRVEGTGLGLAISRDLSRAMGGEITLTSVPGAGSEFVVSVPRA